MPQGVLVVSKDAEFRSALGLCLERLPVRVLQAGSAKEAMDALAQPRLCVLITDVDLGSQRNGLDLARDLRDKVPHLQCIAVGDKGVRGSQGAAAPDRWLQIVDRPFSMIQFVGAVDHALQSTRSRVALAHA